MISRPRIVVTVGRGSAAWVRRGILAAVLLAAAVIPGRASSEPNPQCAGSLCEAEGSVLWTAQLSGSWLAEEGVAGTVPAQGGAYAGAAGNLAVLGYGTTVTAYLARTGQVSWVDQLSGLPRASAIVSVRVWPTAVAVGVSEPAARGGQVRDEIILSASSGSRLRSYRAADYGGAAFASDISTVIVGAGAVTDYANSTGRVMWQQETGAAAQAWMVSGRYLYVTQTSSGYLSASPVTALSRIDLRSGARVVVRPAGRAFAGTLARAVGRVLLFAGSGGVSAYSAQTGRLLWRRPAALVELVDQGSQAVYIASGNDLTALNVTTGAALGNPVASVSASLFAVKNGVALGLDANALGEAWGYSITSRRAVWTSTALPWPHYFVDLTGLGGSISRGSPVTLLTTCAAAGSVPASGSAAPCLRPELAAIQY